MLQSKSNRVWARCIARLLIGVSLVQAIPVFACGGSFFEENLLEDRQASLEGLPLQGSSVEFSRLGLRLSGLGQSRSGGIDGYAPEEFAALYATQRAQVEQRELPAAQFAKVTELRRLTDARRAAAAGTALPAEQRYYVAGAVAFAAYDDLTAAEYFARVLALPPAQRTLRSTWATYSLARLQARSGQVEAAIATFQRVRLLASAGFADPLELGIASLGEEAKLHKGAGNWSQAIRLYASQARHGASIGRHSLRVLAQELLDSVDSDPKLLELAEVQELLPAFVLSDGDFELSVNARTATVARLRAGIAARAQQQGRRTLTYGDRFAALSYRAGDYESAKALVRLAPDSGLTWWLRAKLALRDGDVAVAQAAYAHAVQSFPKDETWAPTQVERTHTKPACRAAAEAAILTLARGEFTAALGQLFATQQYARETADLAERVLTVDELKAFVDAHHLVRDPLVGVLARRLLRAERDDEALRYFFDPQLQRLARAYVDQRRAAERRWTRIGRAEALFDAARIARQSGMQLLGYEYSPDFAVVDGESSTEDSGPVLGPWVTQRELERRESSKARPAQRYHYRFVAAELADRAADLLPPRSQAFASTLCNASGWVIDLDAELGRKYYRRYLEQGPYVAWGNSFAHACPEPDFAAAAQLARRQHWQQLRSGLRRYKVLIAVVACLAIGGLLVLMRRLRSRTHAR